MAHAHNSYLAHQVRVDKTADGALIMGSTLPLGPVVRNTGEWLRHWAKHTPQQIFIASRSGAGWHELTYLETLQKVEALASGLLGEGIAKGDRIVVLSGASVNHGILKLAAQYIGAVTVPLAEQYSLIAQAHDRLDYIAEKVKPALVYAEDGQAFDAALKRPIFTTAIKLVGVNPAPDHLSIGSLLNTPVTRQLEDVYAQVTPDSLAKILFTSGSTSMPKGVPQTHHMMCVNQAQYLACLPFLGERPPVILDWLPWNHVFAGNSDFNMVLSNGGALYLDEGKPVKGLFDKTLENLRLKPGTLSMNVPAGYAMLVDALLKDSALQKAFFGDLDLIFYAGASLPKSVWDALESMAIAQTGRIPMMTSSWGMTETAPMAVIHHQGNARSGMIGVPGPELEAKLIPVEENRFELRVRGPNVMSGYLDDPEKTAESFDEDGFMITHDAVRFADPDNIAEGLLFDGRLSEDFKLLTGTWVQAGNLRLEVLTALSGLIQDVVITGADRADIGVLIFPDPQLGISQSEAGVITDPSYITHITDRLKAMQNGAIGSSKRIGRALILADPPSVKNAEITAKGSLNINAILRLRHDMLERLYNDADPEIILLHARKNLGE